MKIGIFCGAIGFGSSQNTTAAMALDLTGDEREELLISNAHYLLIFANQALNKCENKLYSDDQRKKLHNFTFY